MYRITGRISAALSILKVVDPHAGRKVARVGGACLVGLIGIALSGAPAEAAGERTKGAWSAGTGTWPFIPIHAALTPDGRVLTYGAGQKFPDGTIDPGKQTGFFLYDVWDPAFGLGGGHVTLDNQTQTDLFCSAQLILPNNLNMLLTGGDNWTGTSTTNFGNNDSNLFAFGNNSLTSSAKMNLPRWYGTMTTLPNGEVYIQGGRGGEANPEVRHLNGTFQLLTGANTNSLNGWYPRNWVAPDGRIFGYSDQSMYYVNWRGNGSISAITQMPAGGPRGVTSSEVMYAPGKILRMGGGANNTEELVPGLRGAVTIDINGAAPVVTPTASLPFASHWHTATVIADGRVVVTGGARGNNQLDGVNYFAYIWNPATGTWTKGNPTGSGKARMYHSTSLLLPGGMVMVAGGGAPGPQVNNNAELYYPPYFFNSLNQAAARPTITQAPGALTVGQSFTVGAGNAANIRKVTLIKTGAVTHSFDMDQRFLQLTYTRVGTTNNLTVTAPANANLAPPGMYLLFVIDKNGVPSQGRMIRMNISAV